VAYGAVKTGFRGAAKARSAFLGTFPGPYPRPIGIGEGRRRDSDSASLPMAVVPRRIRAQP